MPGRNGTGPNGTGANGIRGTMAGRCVGPEFPGAGGGFGFGRGRANRRMLGNRRMMGYKGSWMGYQPGNEEMPQTDAPVQSSIEQDLAALKDAINDLNQALADKQQQIEELQQKLEQK